MLLIINALSPQAVEGIGGIHYPCVCVCFILWAPFLLFCFTWSRRGQMHFWEEWGQVFVGVPACACWFEQFDFGMCESVSLGKWGSFTHRVRDKKTTTIPPTLKVTFSAKLFSLLDPSFYTLPPPPFCFSLLSFSSCLPLFCCVIYTFHSLLFFFNHARTSSLIKPVNSSLTLLPSP